MQVSSESVDGSETVVSWELNVLDSDEVYDSGVFGAALVNVTLLASDEYTLSVRTAGELEGIITVSLLGDDDLAAETVSQDLEGVTGTDIKALEISCDEIAASIEEIAESDGAFSAGMTMLCLATLLLL